ncbi:MAG: osmosensitive channel histidine kinaselike protein [Ilumatobacteraceae bacterium]|nr:osmosensitive channel histidine kinaselike protein [Ilumatobacteraceae bacterium]MCU1390752.1 osmosensitive channel histidine kinaselike protein [Ilumatobacteraceae bacterium]
MKAHEPGDAKAYTGLMSISPLPDSQRHDGTVAIAVGPIAAIIVAGLLGHVRGQVGTTNVALVLAAIVVITAMAGRTAGFVTAITAALSFNYFHTAPYNSLRISGGRDVVTVVLLALLGLTVSEISAWRRRNTAIARRMQETAHELEEIVAMIAAGAGPDEVFAVVRPALVSSMGLSDCRYEPLDRTTRVSTRVVLPRSGSLVSPSMHVGIGGFELPAEGVAIEVVNGSTLFGHVVLIPDAQRGSTLDSRRAAVALADLLGMALAENDRVTPTR